MTDLAGQPTGVRTADCGKWAGGGIDIAAEARGEKCSFVRSFVHVGGFEFGKWRMDGWMDGWI